MCIGSLLSRLRIVPSSKASATPAMPDHSKTMPVEDINHGQVTRQTTNLTIPEPMDVDAPDQTATTQSPHSPETDSDDSLPMSPSAFRFSDLSQSRPDRTPTVGPNDIFNFVGTQLTSISEEDDEGVEETTSTGSETVDNGDQKDTTPVWIGPPRLDHLPIKVLKMILSYVFTIGDIVPWFYCGFLDLGVRGYSYADSHVTFRPNLDVAYLLINKACYKAGTDILYGENHFRFDRAELLLWWLRRVGDNNISKIRKLTLNLNTGWRGDLRDPDMVPTPFECSHEKNWYKCLNIIRLAHPKLEHFFISTVLWTPMEQEPLYDEESKEELRKFRKMIFDTIAKFRDVKKAVIKQRGSPYVSAHELTQLMLLMQQRGYTRVETPPPPKLTFSQMMARVKAENEEKMRRALEEVEERRKARRGTAERGG